MTRVLVTGGAGFIGHHLCRTFTEAGAQVVVLDNLSTGRAELLSGIRGELSLERMDIRDDDGVSELLRRLRPEIVIHLAAIHFIPDCNRDPVGTLQVNTVGTAALLESIRREGGARRVLIASTGAVYPPDSTLSRESDTPGPDDIYGQSKLFSEGLLGRFARESGISATAMRIFNVYGPGETNAHVIPEILDQARIRDEIQLGNLTPKRDFIFVTDVAAAFRMAAEATGPLPPSLNVGTGEDHSVTEVVAALGRVTGRPLRAVSNQERVRVSDRLRLRADPSLAKQAIGWSALHDLDSGLRATWEEFAG